MSWIEPEQHIQEIFINSNLSRKVTGQQGFVPLGRVLPYMKEAIRDPKVDPVTEAMRSAIKHSTGAIKSGLFARNNRPTR